MPTIETGIRDLSLLLQEPLSQERLAALLMRVKGEVKAFDHAQDIAKIELGDSNRPDLWSAEGVARQIRSDTPCYPFFEAPSNGQYSVRVSDDMASIRPYLAASVARGITMTKTMLTQLIQSQEKLSDIFGQKRKQVSIGIYRLHKIVFPVHYICVAPEAVRFIPLGGDGPLTLSEILKQHPKGIAYADALPAHRTLYPVLMDANGQILSFPPIINSREVGEVQVGDSDLFVEVTGHDVRKVTLVLNILSCNLSDRGANIEPVTIHYPHETALGKVVQSPKAVTSEVRVPRMTFEKCLGESLDVQEIATVLRAYGYRVTVTGDDLLVTLPYYRDDVMHPVDVVEDYAIGRGLNTFAPKALTFHTIGALSPTERRCDRLREEMVGLGFQEMASNMLGAMEDFARRMNLSDTDVRATRIVHVKNPMSDRFASLRPGLIPALLRVESTSSKTFYPHHIFEIGEVAYRDEKAHPETHLHLAGLMSHSASNFSECHAVVEALFYNLSVAYRLEPLLHPSFIEGRVGTILTQSPSGERAIGMIGEIHPSCLTNWQIGMPTTAFEIEVPNHL